MTHSAPLVSVIAVLVVLAIIGSSCVCTHVSHTGAVAFTVVVAAAPDAEDEPRGGRQGSLIDVPEARDDDRHDSAPERHPDDEGSRGLQAGDLQEGGRAVIPPESLAAIQEGGADGVPTRGDFTSEGGGRGNSASSKVSGTLESTTPEPPFSDVKATVPEAVVTGVVVLNRWLKLPPTETRLAIVAAVMAGTDFSKPVVMFAGPSGVGKTPRAQMLLAAACVNGSRLLDREGSAMYAPFTFRSLKDTAQVFPEDVEGFQIAMGKFDAVFYDELKAVRDINSRAYALILSSVTGGGRTLVRKKRTDSTLIQVGGNAMVIYATSERFRLAWEMARRHLFIRIEEPLPPGERLANSTLLRRYLNDLPRITVAIRWLRENMVAYWPRIETEVEPRGYLLDDYSLAGVFIASILGWPPFLAEYEQMLERERDPTLLPGDEGTIGKTILNHLTAAADFNWFVSTTGLYHEVMASHPELRPRYETAKAFGLQLRKMLDEGLYEHMGINAGYRDTDKGRRWCFVQRDAPEAKPEPATEIPDEEVV